MKNYVYFQGIGGGVTFPGMHVILAHWAPPNERSVMSSIVYSGTALGSVVSILLYRFQCYKRFLIPCLSISPFLLALTLC